MQNFRTYYSSSFRNDINRFFSAIPDESKFHEDREQKQIFSIQYEKLTPQKSLLDFLDKEAKEYFGVALFFTVLTDMVAYAHFRNNYNKFQSLTRYPKFIGNSPAGCHYHFHPRDIFIAMNQRRSPVDPHLVFIDKFSEAIDVMEDECKSFFSTHLPEIDGNLFWERCKSEFPYM